MKAGLKIVVKARAYKTQLNEETNLILQFLWAACTQWGRHFQRLPHCTSVTRSSLADDTNQNMSPLCTFIDRCAPGAYTFVPMPVCPGAYGALSKNEKF